MKTFEKLYKEKQYRQALEYLETHKNDFSLKNYHSFSSTVYFKLENFPMSRFHLMKAEQYGNSSDELMKNELALKSVLDLERLENPINLSDYFYKYSLSLQDGGLSTISLGILILGFLFLYKAKNLKSWLVLSFFASLPILLQFWLNNWNQFIVKKETSLADGASMIFLTEKKISEGVLIVADEKDGWLKVKYPSRFEGWVRKSDLIEVK